MAATTRAWRQISRSTIKFDLDAPKSLSTCTSMMAKRRRRDPEPTTPLDLSSLTTPIRVATCFERYPVVLPPPTPFDKVYHEFKTLVDVQNSAYSYPEMVVDQELKKRAAEEAGGEQKKKKKGGKKTEEDNTSLTTPQRQFHELDLAAIAADQHVDRSEIETDADRNNDTKSLDRALEEKLYLLVKVKGSSGWTLPHVELQGEDMSLRGAAERALKSLQVDEKSFKYFFLGHSPNAVVEDEQADGPVFIYRSMLVNPSATFNDQVNDYLWARASELPELLPESYAKALDLLTLE